MKQSLSNILLKCSQLRGKPAKIKFLREHDSVPLRTLLLYALDPRVEWLLPEGTPEYKENDSTEAQGMLYSELKRLYLFVKGGNDNLKPYRREYIFIQLLEAIDKEDAKLLLAAKDRKLPYKGLTVDLFNEAFSSEGMQFIHVEEKK